MKPSKIKSSIISVFVIIILLSISIFVWTNKNISAHATPTLGYTIVIDPGHGGIDPGCIGRKTKVTEASLNLKIAKKLENLLVSSGFNVMLTRNNENGLYGIYDSDYKLRDMKERKRIIEENKPDAIVSIHMNSFLSTSSRGAQVFFEENNEKSKVLACLMQELLKENIDSSNHEASIGDYYILHCTKYPSVLVECGYLSNAEDESLLTTDSHQEKIAYNIYAGIIAYINEL